MSVQLEKRPTALLLDAGDTLIFFDPAPIATHLRATGIAVEAARIGQALAEAKRDYQRRMRDGQSHEDGWAVLLADTLVGAGVERATATALVPELRRIHDEFNFWRRVPAGVPEALHRARAAGLRLAVISNSEGKLPEHFERVGLGGLFEHVVDSHFEGISKPDPELFLRAVTRMSLQPEQCLYAGDLPDVDVRGAQAAGLLGVLIDPEDRHTTQELDRVRSVVELVDLLLELPAR